MELKIFTYNIQHGLDYKKLLNKERVIDLDLISNIIKKYNPDIIGLNEVYNDVDGKVTVEQVKYIANKLGYNYCYFGRAITILETIDYGNAIISRFPIEDIKVHMIEDPIIKDENVHYETRNIIETKINVNGVMINVFVTHIGLATTEQKNGIDKLMSLINNEKIVIVGDFNMEEDNGNIKRLSNIVDNTSYLFDDIKLSFPSINSKIKIDYIFTKNLKVKEAKILNEVGSDHLPVIAKIEL